MEDPRIPNATSKMDAIALAILALLGLCMLAATANTQRAGLLYGREDFAPFYAGAYALEQGKLYDREALHAIEDERLGFHAEQHGYIRLPFHAALLWPLSRLPYLTAFAIWQISSLLALIAFVALWRPPSFWEVLVWTSMSFPAVHVLIKGQDVHFLLLAITAAVLLHQRGRRFAAGVVFSLCAAKFHLLLLTPVLIVARRDWGFLRGLLSGGTALAAISFAVAGPSWPMEFLQSALNPEFSPGQISMPNLHGAVALLPASLAWEVLGSAIAAVAVWFAARRTDFQYGLAASLIGGLLLSRHSYLLDCTILLPACLTAMAAAQRRFTKFAAALLLTPVAGLAIGFGAPYSSAAVGLALALLIAMAMENRGQSLRPAAEPASPK